MEVTAQQNGNKASRYELTNVYGHKSWILLDNGLNYIDGSYSSTSLATAMQMEAVAKHLEKKA